MIARIRKAFAERRRIALAKANKELWSALTAAGRNGTALSYSSGVGPDYVSFNLRLSDESSNADAERVLHAALKLNKLLNRGNA